MGQHADENLPEVVPGQSPQVLSDQEALRYQLQLEERDPKYPVNLDDAPKCIETEPDHDRIATLSPGGASSVPWEPLSAVDNLPAGDRSTTYYESEKSERGTGMICGLRKKVFWLLLGAVLVIVAASVGGGVGGGIAAANSRTHAAAEADSSSSSSQTSAPAPTSSSTPAPSSSTTSAAPAPEPTYLNNQTFPTPGFAFQAFEGRNYTVNSTKIYREEGFFDLPFSCLSYVWLPNNTDCCITFCNNRTYAGGWWCNEKRQTNASGAFPRIWIGCGKDAHEEHACS